MAIILAHHNSKASKERSKAYRSRGASALPGGVDIVINLENTEEDDIRKLEIAKTGLPDILRGSTFSEKKESSL